ncbi:acyltransferase domain-containing protein [Amycolatopsis sp. 195334CR]|uniref:acyltransferase domain-containing protein n=1 Tax=Amycolatopsis sp. 195334CR TaxID=2814588 RepID=UPI001A8D3C2B|nr:acyltransferase domain-containing protein [Amycolatopsis sp. 195334CR]MBN6042321.1 acyltransferase domain-containing protein [Amycolatopsis sp. 195334CR]
MLHPIPLTGATAAELEDRTAALATELETAAGGLAAVAKAVPVDPAHRHRRCVLAYDTAHALATVRDRDTRWLLTRSPADGEPATGTPSVAVLFAGFGKLSVVRGSDLYDRLGRFRAVADRLSDLLVAEFGVDPRRAMFAPADDPRSAEYEELLRRNTIGHPALFVLEYALLRVWQDWGVEPATMLSHSLGEYVAATAAGVLDAEDALRLIVRRALMVDELPQGRMLAVSLSREGLEPYLREGLWLAATNGPDVSIAAGGTADTEELRARLTADGIRCGLLDTTHAFHTPKLEPVRPRLVDLAASMTRKPPRLRYVSCLTGTRLNPRQATDPEHWGRHMCSPVLFNEGLRALWRRPPGVVLEIGPEQTALNMATRFLASSGAEPAPVVASLAPSPYWESDTDSLLAAAARLWLEGVPVNWDAIRSDRAAAEN